MPTIPKHGVQQEIQRVNVCVLWDTDLFDKQQYMQCHIEPLMPYPIPSSRYGSTSADEINTESLSEFEPFKARGGVGP